MPIATHLGKQSVTYDISVANGAATGTAMQGAEVAPLIDLAANGNRLTWLQHVIKPMRLTLRFEVAVDGNTMTGTAEAGVLPGSKLIGARR